MDIQTRKIVLIEEFLRITDETIITKVESLVKIEKEKRDESKLKPMSLKEFHEMIDQAKLDSYNGRVIMHEDLKKKVKSWR
jgi:hypothetical protein